MDKHSSVLAIIPARGGSKGVIGKNIRVVGGLPLIAHTIKSVVASRLVTQHLVTTDNDEIAKVALEFGGNVPFIRPNELAQDGTSVIDVVQHVLEEVHGDFEYLLLLQPTSPLRTTDDIDAVLTIAFNANASSVVSLQLMDGYHPSNMYYVDGDQLQPVGQKDHSLPRQSYRRVGWRNGALYLVKTRKFLDQETFVTDDCLPYFMPAARSVNIDSEEDLWLAERYFNELVNQPDHIQH